MKSLIFYSVMWRDAEVHPSWETVDSIQLPTKLTTSFGYYIKETDDYFTIAADYDEATNHFNRFISIPKGMIQSKKKIKL